MATLAPSLSRTITDKEPGQGRPTGRLGFGRMATSEHRLSTDGMGKLSVAVITCLFTACIALIVALGSSTRTTSYDRDQAFIKASISQNASDIHDLTVAVQALTVQEAQLQEQVSQMDPAKTKP